MSGSDATAIDLDAERRKRVLTGAVTTDAGNGERLVARHGDRIRYHMESKHWYLWDGKRWEEDRTREIERLALETLRALMKASWDEGGEKGEVLRKHAVKSEASGRLVAMLTLAGSMKGMQVHTTDFDADPWMLNVLNGVVNLQTGELIPHDRDLLLTKLAPVTFAELATCPTWLAFLDRIFAGDQELIAYVKRAVGYTLTGKTNEQCLHLLYGTGQNGKSTFVNVLNAMLGDYGDKAEFSSFLDRAQPNNANAPREDMARLAGARFVRASESGEGRRFNEALLKDLTGSEPITARYLYASTFRFTPSFKLWLSANHRPVIRGTDKAIWRRLREIPFKVEIPDAERDDELESKLLKELSGILAWAVEGCQEWRDGGLKPPQSVLDATADYRSNSDILGAWRDDCCDLDPSFEDRANELFASYKRWAADGQEHVMSQTAFGRRLEEMKHAVEKRGGFKYRKGLRLRDDSHQQRELPY